MALFDTAVAADAVTSPIVIVALCQQCGEHPRAGKGALTRCIPCIKSAAQEDRLARQAAEAALAAKRDEAPAKACRSCKKTKALTEYARHRLSRDQHRHDCRQCVSAGKAKRPKPMTPAQLEAKRIRQQQPEHRAKNLEAVVAWQQRNPDAVAARRAVSRAVRQGILKAPKVCQVRGCRRRKLDAHHNSYSHRCRLRVAWVCGSCHARVHAGLRLKLKAGAAYRTAYAPETH